MAARTIAYAMGADIRGQGSVDEDDLEVIITLQPGRKARKMIASSVYITSVQRRPAGTWESATPCKPAREGHLQVTQQCQEHPTHIKDECSIRRRQLVRGNPMLSVLHPHAQPIYPHLTMKRPLAPHSQRRCTSRPSNYSSVSVVHSYAELQATPHCGNASQIEIPDKVGFALGRASHLELYWDIYRAPTAPERESPYGYYVVTMAHFIA
ncbi:hypothetical protein FB567DRAFT_548250 [Paraphoma chrysanthemicola]|uniref:Uncharacterized protein n=1 Tax=Paraphoma chrysanthemicola TaxID=798071 RepID=A0A8K0VZ01_9PLEO|nr:hypothetical protein FB567DRAFT_548250 [Paraphoma chrysanthemicola]